MAKPLKAKTILKVNWENSSFFSLCCTLPATSVNDEMNTIEEETYMLAINDVQLVRTENDVAVNSITDFQLSFTFKNFGHRAVMTSVIDTIFHPEAK